MCPARIGGRLGTASTFHRHPPQLSRELYFVGRFCVNGYFQFVPTIISHGCTLPMLACYQSLLRPFMRG